MQQHPVPHCDFCNTLQHAATQKTFAEKGFPAAIKVKCLHIKTHCNTMQQHTAPHSDTLQHAATRKETCGERLPSGDQGQGGVHP